MLESLLCNSCGAPLEVPQSAKFAKCNHCGTTLKIHRSEGTITTEAIEKLTETAENLAAQVQQLTRQNQLDELDRNWQTQQESFMVTGKDGARHLPARGFAWATGIAAVFFGGIWTVFATSITQSAPDEGPFKVAKFVFPLFGIGFIAFGLVMAVMVHHKANQFEAAEREFRRRRSHIVKGDQ